MYAKFLFVYQAVFSGDVWLSLVFSVRVGKKNAIYLPKRAVKALGIGEGDRLILQVRGRSLVLRKVEDFFEASLKSQKKIKLSPEEAEEASLEAQREILGV